MTAQALRLLAAAGLLTACTTTEKGQVAMMTENREAHVNLGADSVAVGDKVRLSERRCGPDTGTGKPGGAGPQPATCETVELGEAEVVRIIDSNYSVIRAPEGVHMDKNTLVEKIQAH